MSYEVACGECGECIVIEELGVEVHCPHCEATLVLTADDVRRAQLDSATQVAAPAPVSDSDRDEDSSDSQDDTIADFNLSNEPFGVADEFDPDADAAPDFNFIGESSNVDQTVELTGFSIKTGDSAIGVGESKSAAAPSAKSDKRRRSATRRKADLSSTILMSLASYSVLATVALLYLFFRMKTGAPHQLESLPDIPLLDRNQFIIYRENASLAPGHSLRLGETQQFGSIAVTPLKVTREPIQFRHFQHARANSLPPTAPVLKLWLKIENVSDDQMFPPFDKELVNFRRSDEQDIYRVRANNWICRESDLPTLEDRILMYDHAPTSEFDIDGMVVRPLKPGESVETFLPSQEEDLGRLKGSLVWRFQIRKGFNPKSMNGVTTLVEVLFDSSDI